MSDPERDEPTGGMPVILIADDDAPIAEVLAAFFEDIGYSAVIATDGRQALDLARTCQPALIITDLMMPRMTGAELLAAIRADAAATGCEPPPAILMSAADSRYTDIAGADAVLLKPCELNELEALLKKLLGPRAR